jgi:hypothetical protein
MSCMKCLGVLRRWTNASISKHTLTSIIYRDKRFETKESDGSERYTTCERIFFALFYCFTLLFINLSVAICIGSINTNCELSSKALAACLSGNSDPTISCKFMNNTIGPFEFPSDEKRLSIGQKHPAFLNELESREYFYYVLNSSSDGPGKSDQTVTFEYWAHSFVCLLNGTLHLPDGLYPETVMVCIHPQLSCTFSTQLPTSFTYSALRKFAIRKAVAVLFTTIAIYVLLTPISLLLSFMFTGCCEPKIGSWARIIYKIAIVIVSILALIMLAFWIGFFALFTFGYYTNVPRKNKTSIALTTLASWVFSIVVLEYVQQSIVALVFQFKYIFMNKVDGQLQEQVTEKVEEMQKDVENQLRIGMAVSAQYMPQYISNLPPASAVQLPNEVFYSPPSAPPYPIYPTLSQQQDGKYPVPIYQSSHPHTNGSNNNNNNNNNVPYGTYY